MIITIQLVVQINYLISAIQLEAVHGYYSDQLEAPVEALKCQ